MDCCYGLIVFVCLIRGTIQVAPQCFSCCCLLGHDAFLHPAVSYPETPGQVFDKDEYIKGDTSLQQLQKLKPAFKKARFQSLSVTAVPSSRAISRNFW